LIVMSFALLAGLFVVSFNPDLKASTYMRSRLWPELRPGQLLSANDPVPAAGVTA
jgi:hypothetical protein